MLKLMKQYSLWSHIKASSLALLGTLVWGGFTPSLAIGYQSVMFGGNYLGGPSFDDNLSLSALALAQNFDKWGNWDLSGSKKNIDLLPGNTNATGFLNALNPYKAGGAKAMKSGDLFVLFYFGHGSSVTDAERYPALNTRDETLYFPNTSQLIDDTLTAGLAGFNSGVYKLFVNISCYSGGFWNGNDLNSVGDIEKLSRSILFSSSRENQLTYTGGLAPRPWEPIFLHNLILNISPSAWPGQRSVTIQQWYDRSRASGSAINQSRFVPGEDETPDEILDNNPPAPDGPFDSGFDITDDVIDPPPLFETVPEPTSTLGLLAIGTLGAASTLKRKLKPSKSDKN